MQEVSLVLISAAPILAGVGLKVAASGLNEARLHGNSGRFSSILAVLLMGAG